MATAMMIETTEGLRETRTHNLESTNPKEIVAHVRKGGTTGGFSITFAVNPATKEVAEIIKKGHLTQKDVKPLIEAGFTEYLWSWAFSGKNFKMTDGTIAPITKKIDLITRKEVMRWAPAFGY